MSPTDPPTTLGLLQYAPQSRSLDHNLYFLCEQLQDTTDAVIVLPELYLGSYTTNEVNMLHENELQTLLLPLLELSRRQRVSLVGSLPILSNQECHNRAVVIDEGAMLFPYDKVLLFGSEWLAFTPGRDPFNVVELRSVAFAVQICLDVINPLPAYRAIENGATFIACPASVSVDYLRTVQKNRAIEHHALSVFCNRCGMEQDGTRYMGLSCIFLPDGEELSLGPEEEALALITLREKDFEVGKVCPRPTGPGPSPTNA